MPSNDNRNNLQQVIRKWVDEKQADDELDMWISDSLITAMTTAAWAVLEESRETQQWLKAQGYMNDD